MAESFDEEKVEFLRASFKKIGALYPVLISKEDGSVIDGRHRLKANRNWVRKKISGDKFKGLMMRGHANWVRWSAEDKTNFLNELGALTDWRTAKPFAEALGWNERTIQRYLPEEFKQEAHAVRKGKTFDDSLSSNEDEVEEVDVEARETAELIYNTIRDNAGELTRPPTKKALEQSNRLNINLVLKMLDKGLLYCPDCKQKELVWKCCKKKLGEA